MRRARRPSPGTARPGVGAPSPGGPATHLTAARRAADLDRLAAGETVDVLVVGGGITGVGVALDAATRGLSVALVERGDLATGTSRWSSKLAHGGLRYLAQGRFGIAWESARERGLLADVIAPHLIRALPQVTPLYGRAPQVAPLAVAAGVRTGDAMRALAGTSGRRLPRMRRVSAAEARLWAPALDSRRLRGALLHWDGQLEDDARLVVTVARTAAAHGAMILTRAEALELRADGATVRDRTPRPGTTGDEATATAEGRTFELRARHVVNATGVWAGDLVDGVTLRPSRGSHLLLPAERLGNPRAAVNVPVPGRFGRFVFALPRPDGLVLVGITDEPHDGPVPDAPLPTPEEEDFLLRTLSTALGRPVGPEDVVGRFAGLRPLLDTGGGGRTADVSRRHLVVEDPRTQVITVVGGKLTTYRRMAEDAVDRVVARPGVTAGRCLTTSLPLVGAPAPGAVGRGDGRRDPGAERVDPRPAHAVERDRGGDAGGPSVPERLLRRFGTEAPAVVALAGGDPSLLEPIASGVSVLGVEVLAAVRWEGALTLGDVLDRRTRLGLVPAWRDLAAEPVERLMGRTSTPTSVA
ncbi:MAG: glycerol-3-phosphate dehydrogenase/oxidase [Solirubrobacteraceae bacterium]